MQPDPGPVVAVIRRPDPASREVVLELPGHPDRHDRLPGGQRRLARYAWAHGADVVRHDYAIGFDEE